MEPDEQLDGLLWRYAIGQRLIWDREYHPLMPHGDGVWEMKTPDVRVFGWFGRRDCFVATFGAAAALVKRHGLYHGFKNETLRIRGDLGLPHVEGVDPDDVLSTAS